MVFLLALLIGCNHVPAPQEGVRPIYGAYTPESVESAVYKLEVEDSDGLGWIGTGWKIADDTLITAGHVCDPEGAAPLRIVAKSRWNLEYPVTVRAFSEVPDLCVLDAPDVPGPALNRLVPLPAYGHDVWYVGAPKGVFGNGVAPFARGHYVGNKTLMIAGYPGASGSPVFLESGVVGVLVRGLRGTHLIEIESSADLQSFYEAVLATKDSPLE